MAEEKFPFPFLKKAHELKDNLPWPDDIEEQIDKLCKQAGEDTAEGRMIGILLGGVITELHSR